MALAVCSCQVVETTEPQSTNDSESKVFTATIEDNATRTSLDADGNVLWKKGDQVSIFAASTVNEHYQVSDDSDGKTSASLNKISSTGSVSGGEIDNNVAFYPYASTAEIAQSGSAYIISDINIPSVQYYAEGSFGNGAFPMAAVTSSSDDLHLKFKNVLGGLKLQLKGTATITSITVTGNNNEILCGAAEMTVSNTSTPSINLTDATAKTVTLDCGEGVTLNTETTTSFIIALPPMTMEGGFTVVVTDTEGKQMEIKTTKSQTINRSMLLKMPAVNYEGIPMSSPLTFISTGETSISLVKEGSPDDVSLEYSVNGGGWTTYSVGDAIALADGEIVSFRAGAGGNTSLGKSYSDYHKFIVSGSGTVAASGSIMSLINQEESTTIPSSYCFCRLFKNCTGLTSAPELPVTTLAEYCYFRMFEDCTSLTTAPVLPATTLASCCYMDMFYGCTSLTAAPELPATTLAEWCYYEMFYGCTSLTTAPVLPATTLASCCYMDMFNGCTSLAAAPELPATSLVDRCYAAMFANCTSLTTAPELPVTTLAYGCYGSMFAHCTSLTAAPELPATTLAKGCYSGLFSGCTSLTAAPELPVATLAEGCYSGMFKGCTALTIAPELPATTAAYYCYNGMFEGCTSLTAAPELPATTLAEQCYYYMFRNCTSLTTAPELPATTLAKNCYGFMFDGCTGLTAAPELPATTLAEECYRGMFMNCTSLTAAPELPATTLASRCYDSMFYQCRSLTAAPELPATTLANVCYRWMFGHCTSLTTAPELPATTLANGCYDYMFHGCIRLNYIKALFTTTPDDTYTKDWVSGVASTGTFVKNKEATWDVTGVNGVPEGWTVLTDVPVPEAVDLGLPSGLKWASFNVGATKPEEYGDYYAWGEVETKEDYTWETYKWCNGSNNTLTKYNTQSENGTVDNKTTLDPEDDVARVVLGGTWRMPTVEEAEELYNNCTWTMETVNGVSGYRATSSNSNSIFFPCNGQLDEYGLENKNMVEVWTIKCYGTYAYRLAKGWFGDGVFAYSERHDGLCIRAVCE